MKKINFFLVVALAIVTLGSCSSRLSEEEINKKVDEQFEAGKAALTAELDAACEATLLQTAEAKANVMADSIIAAPAAEPMPAGK